MNNQLGQVQNQQSQSAIVLPIKLISNMNEIKVPQVQYPQHCDPSIDFQFEAFKLVQANATLTQLIKQAINEKYSVSQKIIKVNEHIKKLQAKNAK